jgi:hypothetical protein
MKFKYFINPTTRVLWKSGDELMVFSRSIQKWRFSAYLDEKEMRDSEICFGRIEEISEEEAALLL